MATIVDINLTGGQLNLVGSADVTYRLVVPTNIGTGLPHYLDNQVIEECYINCDTTNDAVNIILPPISAFKGSWGPKLYISKISSGSNVTYSVDNPLAESIGLQSSWTIPNGANLNTAYLHVVDYYLWAQFINPTL